MFITLEGSEGAGKSTLIEHLKKYFLNKKIELLHDDELVATEGQRAYKFLNELIREEEMINTFEKLIEH